MEKKQVRRKKTLASTLRNANVTTRSSHSRPLTKASGLHQRLPSESKEKVKRQDKGRVTQRTDKKAKAHKPRELYKIFAASNSPHHHHPTKKQRRHYSETRSFNTRTVAQIRMTGFNVHHTNKRTPKKPAGKNNFRRRKNKDTITN